MRRRACVGLASVAVAAIALVARPASAHPGESSFTPTGLRVPLHGIRLENGADPSAHASLYECPSHDPSACLVDMADDAALAATCVCRTRDARRTCRCPRRSSWRKAMRSR